MVDLNSIRIALQYSKLFAGSDPYSLRNAFVKAFKRGDEVSETQDGTDCVGVVLQGSLTVAAGGKNSVSVMRRGGEFGICNIFVREKMPTKLTAKVSSRILFLSKEEFVRLLGQDSGLMYRYVKLCNEKMVYLAERLRLISISDCVERVYYYLTTEAEDGRVRLTVPKDELARQLGISRSSLFRALSALESSGRIISSGGLIILSQENFIKEKSL